ncbi:MAG: radical SAM protein [Phycisphaerae bacterium]|nr:radical SAM protein [Phycisphaerae bacterium]
MRILVIQMQATSVPKVRPRFDQALGVLASVLRQDGHQLELAAFSRYQSPEIHDAICRFRPQAIYLQADRFAADITRHAVEFVGRHHVLPVIIGGLYATAQPDAAMSIPGVLAVAIGEPEISVRRFLFALERGDDYERTPGIWINPSDAPAVKNEPAPLSANLDVLPMADRELFDYGAYVARTHAAQVAVARGCPHKCAYCLSDWLADIYLGRGPWVRRRSPGNVCDEIDQLCERYPQIERIQFMDHAFALDRDWLAKFSELYAERCGLPFTCHLRANAIDAESLRLLKEAGCDNAIVELISGSDFVRNEIFDMDTSSRQIERAFRLLATGGIRTTVVHLLGTPYETAITVDHTLELIDRIRPALVHTRLFVPLPGTRAEELCRDSGWLTGLGEKAFRENTPMLRMPAMPAAELTRLLHEFNWQARHPRSSGLMKLLAKLPVGRGKTLYDLLVRHPIPNGRLLPSDPRSIDVREMDGVMNP